MVHVNPRRGRIAAAMTFVAVVLSAAPALAQEAIVGERLAPDALGPGFVEGLAAAVERDALRRAAEAERGPDEDAHGAWVIPPRRASRFPHSGERYVTNTHGDTSMGIGFGRPVDVHGAYVAVQISPDVTTRGLVVVGYRDGVEIARTAPYRAITTTPSRFDMNLRGVDRIVFEAEAALDGAAWYALDDLDYSAPTADGVVVRTVVDFEDARHRQVLTGSDYRGLTWESGTGDFGADEAVHPPMPDPAQDLEPEAPEGGGAVALGGGGTLPDQLLQFTGVLRGDAGSNSYPPDSNGAIGPDHFVITVNRNFAIYDKDDGAEITNIHLGSFLPGSNGDPRVLYDHFVDRWIVIVSDFDDTTRIYLAVSTSDDPTGTWFKTSFVTAAGSDAGCWPDYPTLGLDADGYYIGANMVGCAGTIFAIEKAPLVDPVPSLGVITAFRNIPLDGAIQPCLTYGDSGGELFVSRQNSTALRVRKLQGDITNPTLVTLALVTIPSHAPPPDVPALGSDTDLDHSVAHRLLNAVYRNGSIWTVHDISVNGRSSVRWYEIDGLGLTTNQVGTIADGSLHYLYGGIGVNAQSDVVIGFTGSNASIYPACYFTGRSATDPPGETAVPNRYRTGNGAQNNIDGFGRNRWGDYSLTTVDPDDDLTFWTVQEYAAGENVWGTAVLQARAIVPLIGFDYPDGRPAIIDPAGDALRVEIDGQFGGVVDPASPTLHYDAGDGFVVAPMTMVAPGAYDAIFPALPCGATVQYYVRATTDEGDAFSDPSGAPSTTYTTETATGVVAVVDDFETDLGWTAENLGASSGDWERGVPVNDPGWEHDPVSDGDGSGQCFLTENQAGNTDVDNGSVRLTSPSYDLSGVAPTLAYDYFLKLTNENGVDRILVEASGNGMAGPWFTIAVHDTNGDLGWREHTITGAEMEAAGVVLSNDVRVRFTANDGEPQSIVEAGIDGVVVRTLECDETILGDIDGDGVVAFPDLLLVLTAWGPCPAPPAECPADLDGDGSVGFADLLLVLANWTV